MKKTEMQNTAIQRNANVQGAYSGVNLIFGITPEFAPRNMRFVAFICRIQK